MLLLGTLAWLCPQGQASRQRRSVPPIHHPSRTVPVPVFNIDKHIGIAFLLTRTITCIFGSSTSLVEPMSAVSLSHPLSLSLSFSLTVRVGRYSIASRMPRSEMRVSRLERTQPPEVLCNVYWNETPAQLTDNLFGWICARDVDSYFLILVSHVKVVKEWRGWYSIFNIVPVYAKEGRGKATIDNILSPSFVIQPYLVTLPARSIPTLPPPFLEGRKQTSLKELKGCTYAYVFTPIPNSHSTFFLLLLCRFWETLRLQNA